MNPPDLPMLRPLPQRERLALFSMLGNVEGTSMSDLFAGSGIVAFEFLSRGAESAVAVEKDKRLCQFMRDQARKWNVNLQVVCKDVFDFLHQPLNVDYVFAGPPNNKGLVSKTFDALKNIRYAGLVIIQHSVREPLPDFVTILRSTGKDESIVDIVKLMLD
jgi:16S rRNA (guanine966-N2)-methyltransferase